MGVPVIVLGSTAPNVAPAQSKKTRLVKMDLDEKMMFAEEDTSSEEDDEDTEKDDWGEGDYDWSDQQDDE